MIAFKVDEYKDSQLEMKFEKKTLSIAGTIDYREPDKILEPFFGNLHSNILKSGIKKIEIDVTKLLFLNSSGIKEFVQWFINIELLSSDKRYQVKFLINSNLLWQESTISTIININPSFIRKEIVV